jgi:pimeloyl-ACP methyl ester carboxylesterase
MDYGPYAHRLCSLSCFFLAVLHVYIVPLDLKLSKRPAALVGYDMGGAVAAGFAAKYPAMCKSLSLLSPIGVKFKPLAQEKLMNRKYIGEMLMFSQRKTMHETQEADFFDRDESTSHRYLIDKQIAMMKWQIKHTPGYLGALLSTYRYFPLRGMEELYTAIGRHPRKTLVIWGDHDEICNYRKSIKVMEESFPNGTIVDVLNCGHNLVAERFEDIMKELLSFNKDVFESSESAL